MVGETDLDDEYEDSARTVRRGKGTELKIYLKTEEAVRTSVKWFEGHPTHGRGKKWQVTTKKSRTSWCASCKEFGHWIADCEHVMQPVRLHFTRPNTLAANAVAKQVGASIGPSGPLWYDLEFLNTPKNEAEKNIATYMKKGKHRKKIFKYMKAMPLRRKDCCTRCGLPKRDQHKGPETCSMGFRPRGWTPQRRETSLGTSEEKESRLLTWDAGVRAGKSYWETHKLCYTFMHHGFCKNVLLGSCTWHHPGAEDTGILPADTTWGKPATICPQGFIGQVCQFPMCDKVHKQAGASPIL
jgi:hypothetical protein